MESCVTSTPSVTSKEHLAASESVRWSDFAQAISDMQNREDVLWMAINGRAATRAASQSSPTR